MYGILQFLWTITNFQHLWTAESDQEAKSLTIQSNARHYRRCELAFNILRRHNWNINQPKKQQHYSSNQKRIDFLLFAVVIDAVVVIVVKTVCDPLYLFIISSKQNKRETQSSCVSQSVCVYIYICARESVCVCDTNKEQLGFARD